MAHSTINTSGVGGTQAGTAVTTTSGNKTVVFTNESSSPITLDPVSYTHLTLPTNREV